MPAERTTMRQVREVLRLKFVGGKGIKPARAPRRFGQACIHEALERRQPVAKVDLELCGRRVRVAASEHLLGEACETIRLRRCLARCLGQIEKKLLKICVGRGAIKAQSVALAVLLILELSGVAGGACHAEGARGSITIDDEAYRKAKRIGRGRWIGKISIALKLIACERLIDVGATQGLEPGIGEDPRALTGRVKNVAVGVVPALCSVGDDRLRTPRQVSVLGPTEPRRNRTSTRLERVQIRARPFS